MDTAATIAAGGQPVWRETYTHPKYGELEFSIDRLPVNRDWLAHAVAQEHISPGVQSVLAAAIAGMQTFIKVPAISEKRIEDPDNGHVRIEQTFYDPMDDEDLAFPVKVWTDFFQWRADSLSEATQDAVKNSSGATDGPESADSSPATTPFPPTTLE